MDSGNSGSLQSSSGREDEFDSRCGGGGGGGGVDSESSSLSALLRQSASPSPSFLGFGGSFYGLQELATTPLPPLPQAVHHWSAALPAGGGAASPSSSSSLGMPAAADQAAPAQPELPAPPRGSRKRTRASRRAPTTVLTTDTTNFRAMVQEFTGIPSPPFAATPARSRFDHLFPSPSSLRSAPGAAANAASFPPYLLRPFAQKLQPSPFSPFASPSASSPAQSNIATAPPTGAVSASTSAAAVASGDSYQYHLLGSAPAPSALLGMRDHCGNYLSFQSPLGAQLGGDAKYASHPLFDAGGHGLLPSPRLQDSSDFLGLAHGIQLGSEGTHLHPHNRDHEHRDDELTGMFAGASGTGGGGGRRSRTIYSPDAAVDRAKPLLEQSVESTSSAGLTATTTTTTTAAATAAMRTQGVDSWICTSEE